MNEPIRNRILDTAHHKLQAEGYGALHYADIAAELDITRAAIHYHFPQKVDLVRAVIARYTAATAEHLELISVSYPDVTDRLRAYTDLYREVLLARVMLHCPGGMLAAEIMTLPDELGEDVKEFFRCHVEWLERELKAADGAPPVIDSALGLVSFLQGSLLLARLYDGVESFDNVVSQVLGLGVPERTTTD